MQEVLSLLILAVVQGIAEWIPVSSSGHLVLVGSLLGFSPDRALLASLHLGTLLAVCVYFGQDIVGIIRALVRGEWRTGPGRLGLLVGMAFLPLLVIGWFVRDASFLAGTSWLVLGGGWLVTSMVLFVGSYAPRKTRSLSFLSAFLIGCAQLLSLLRGISRSGSTLSTGLWLGLSEREAVRFSFLLSIPVVLGANILSIAGDPLPSSYFIGTLVAFLVGLGGIHFAFTRLLARREHLRWFAGYTGFLGLLLLMWELFL